MIAEFAKEQFIKVNALADSWKDAIVQAGELLLNNDCIEPCYVQEMIRMVEEAGPYMVIAPGVALAHARPEDGVKKIGLAFMTLKNPVEFGNPDNDPVRLVIALGAVDNSSHLEVIAEMAELLIDENAMEKLYACGNAKEMAEFLRTFEGTGKES